MYTLPIFNFHKVDKTFIEKVHNSLVYGQLLNIDMCDVTVTNHHEVTHRIHSINTAQQTADIEIIGPLYEILTSAIKRNELKLAPRGLYSPATGKYTIFSLDLIPNNDTIVTLDQYQFTYENLIELLLCRIREQKKETLDKEFLTVTLVGSTKFPEVWIETQRELTLHGAIVHTVGLFGHQEKIDMNGPIKRMLDRVYLQKIRQSNCILVLNKNGYIGLGAWDEIFYAIAQQKGIYFLEPLSTNCLKLLWNLIVDNCSFPNPIPLYL